MAVKVLTLFDEFEGIESTANAALPDRQATAVRKLPPVFLENWEAAKRYYSIGEVSLLFSMRSSAIRYWVKEFELKIKTNTRGDRHFTADDIDTLRIIYGLLNEEGYTIEGAKRKLESGSAGIAVDTNNLIQKLLQYRNKLVQLNDAII